MYIVTPDPVSQRRRTARAARASEKPSWGWLYTLVLLMLGLLALVETRVPAGTGRRVLEIAIVVVAFGAIYLWVCANRRAFDLAGVGGCGLRQPAQEAGSGDLAGRAGDAGVTALQAKHSKPATTLARPRGTVIESTRRYIGGG